MLKIDETLTRLNAASPASRRAISKLTSLVVATPTPLVKNTRFGTKPNVELNSGKPSLRGLAVREGPPGQEISH